MRGPRNRSEGNVAGASAQAELVRESVQLLSSASTSRGNAIRILTSPKIMADILRSRLAGIAPEGTVLRECRPKVLRNRLGSRQVVFYRLLFEERRSGKIRHLKLILKRYSDRSEGRKTYAVMRMLWQNGFDRESRLRICEPFSYWEDLGLLVLEEVRGVLLRKSLEQGDQALPPRMKSAAQWLSKLHRLSAGIEWVPPHADDGESLTSFLQETGRAVPLLSSKLEEMASNVPAKVASFAAVPLVPSHGDFQCENIFVDRDRVTVVDFDRFCRSDPARDPGYIIAQMRIMGFWGGASPELISGAVRAFWDEYLIAVPAEEREAISARACLFAARRGLQNVYYMSTVLPAGGLKELSIVLNDALRFSRADRVEDVFPVPISVES